MVVVGVRNFGRCRLGGRCFGKGWPLLWSKTKKKCRGLVRMSSRVGCCVDKNDVQPDLEWIGYDERDGGIVCSLGQGQGAWARVGALGSGPVRLDQGQVLGRVSVFGSRSLRVVQRRGAWTGIQVFGIFRYGQSVRIVGYSERSSCSRIFGYSDHRMLKYSDIWIFRRSDIQTVGYSDI